MDLNADLGEGYGAWSMGDDAAMLAIVSSVNLACGFHAGDPSVMRRLCALAAAASAASAAASAGSAQPHQRHHPIAVGAHVSYDDRAGFGRRFVDVEPSELTDLVLYQVAALDGIARAEGLPGISHIKAHGALYTTVVQHERQASALLAAILAFDPSLPVIAMAPSVFVDQARAAGVPVVLEAFADRAYTTDATLVPRSQPGAVLHDPQAIADRVAGLVEHGALTSRDGEPVAIEAQSICVHGDTPGAVQIAAHVRDQLVSGGCDIAPPLVVRQRLARFGC